METAVVLVIAAVLLLLTGGSMLRKLRMGSGEQDCGCGNCAEKKGGP